MTSTTTQPTIPVVVKDTDRDGIDWTLSVLSALSAFAAVVALILARRANEVAKKVDAGTKRFVVEERRKLFELDLLKQLMEFLDARDNFHQALTNPENIREFHGGKLALIQAPELPTWHLLATSPREAIAEHLGMPDYHQTLTQSDKAELRRRLLDELTTAIKARMLSAEDPAQVKTWPTWRLGR